MDWSEEKKRGVMKPVRHKIQEKLIMKVISDLLVAAPTHYTSCKRVVYVAKIELHYQTPILIERNGLGKRTCNGKLLQKLTPFRKRTQKEREIKGAGEMIAYPLT